MAQDTRRIKDRPELLPGSPETWWRAPARNLRTNRLLRDLEADKLEADSDTFGGVVATAGTVLVYNGTTWIPTLRTNLLDLDDLTDVNLTAPAINQFLRYDGTRWTNQAVTIVSTLDDLSDVVITGAATGNFLVKTSTNWVNQNFSRGKLGIGTTLDPTFRFELEDGDYTAWFDGTNSNPLSGARGWHLNKAKTRALPHTITWRVDGHPSWEIGMDFDTNNALSSGFGNADMVLAYDPTAGKNDAGVGAGTGADIFRFSPAEASVAGDNYGRVGLGFRQGTPNTAGSAWFTVSSPPNVVGLNLSHNSTFSFGYKMVQRGAHNRCQINFNDKWCIGSDYAAANAQTFQLRDLATGAHRLWVDSSGRFQIGGTSPGAFLHLPAGAAGASNAPLKFTSGTSLTTAENGAMEYDGTNFYLTPSGATRRTVDYLPVTPPDYTVTNHTDQRSIDETAITLGGLANVVGTLVNDLIAQGRLQ